MCMRCLWTGWQHRKLIWVISIQKRPLQYYEKGAAKLGKMIHPETAALIHKLLKMLAEKGERATFKYVREQVRELKRQHMI